MTLIEVMAALTVFALLLVGVTPLLASSLKGAGLSRTYVVGKNLTQQAMERVRGLPYFTTDPQRDVLDFYFPNLSSGYNATTKSFTTTCTKTTSTPTASGAFACPKDANGDSQLPDDHTMKFVAEFVTATTSSGQEVYSAVAPPVGYNSNVADSTAPTNLLRLTLTTSWSYGAKDDVDYTLTTLLGERNLSVERFEASADVGFTVQALTSYKDDTERLSVLDSVLGAATSTAELANFAAADADASSARLTLSREETETAPGEILVEASGAQAGMTSPPNVTPTSTTSSSVSVAHPDLGNAQIAHVDGTSVNDSASPAPGVAVTSELPTSATNFSGSSGQEFWLDNQADATLTGRLQLDLGPDSHVLALHGTGSDGLSGSTHATTTDVNPYTLRKVESSADSSFSKMVLLPTGYIPDDKGVVVVEDFTATADCKSNGALSGAIATGSWSANLKVWLDADPSDGLVAGSYVDIALSGSTTSTSGDSLAAFNLSNNPLVLDSPDPASRVYLFDDPTNDLVGYLDSWSSAPLMSTVLEETTSSVDMSVALSFATAKTDPANDASKLIVNVGKLSCKAVDARG